MTNELSFVIIEGPNSIFQSYKDQIVEIVKSERPNNRYPFIYL